MRLPRIAVVFVSAALALLTGCTAARRAPDGGTERGPVAAGSSTRTITVDGRTRTYHVYRPASLPASTPVPLVVMLHGGFGSGSQAEQSYGWDGEADSEHFVVAYPDGIGHAWAVGDGCCGDPGRTGVDDVHFITEMVGALTSDVPVDPGRVYATGMSNGALFSDRLACDTTVFAAIAPVAGTLLGECPSPAPISVLHIHGLADRNVPFDGSQGEGVAKIDGPPVPDVVAMWRQVDKCAAPTVTTAGPVTTSVADCPGGHTVELITIDGAGHQWPGASPHPAMQKIVGTDPPATAVNATDTIWRFFAAHPKSGG